MKKLKNFHLSLNKTIRIRYLLLFIIILTLISFGLGFLWGVDTTAREVAKLSKVFLNISIDKDLITEAIYRYNNQIGGCIG